MKNADILEEFNGLIEALKICFIWDKVFKSGPSKVCGRQSLKNLKEYGLLKYIISLQIS